MANPISILCKQDIDHSPPLIAQRLIERTHKRTSLPAPIYDERIYAMLIGSLSDGPVLVDPMDVKAAAQVKAARKSIVKGLDALHDLGQKLHVARGKVAGAQPLAADDDVGEARGGGKQMRGRGGKVGRKNASAMGQVKVGRKRIR